MCQEIDIVIIQGIDIVMIQEKNIVIIQKIDIVMIQEKNIAIIQEIDIVMIQEMKVRDIICFFEFFVNSEKASIILALKVLKHSNKKWRLNNKC
jgi:hypothetical protein